MSRTTSFLLMTLLAGFAACGPQGSSPAGSNSVPASPQTIADTGIQTAVAATMIALAVTDTRAAGASTDPHTAGGAAPAPSTPVRKQAAGIPTARPVTESSASPVPGTPAVPTAARPLATATVQAAAAAPQCRVPTFSDEYIGFEVGHPAGWSIDYINGTITVQKDSTGTIAALVYPVRGKAGYSSDELLVEYVQALNSALALNGDRLAIDGGRLTGSINQTSVRGALRAKVSGPDQVVHGGWAPDEQWTATEETILSIGDCYRGTPGKVLQRGRQTGTDATGGSTTFQFLVPEGWKVTGITSRGIDIMLDDLTGTSFAYLTNAPGTMTPEGFIDWVLQAAGYRNVQHLASQDLEGATDPLGLRWNMKSGEFTATSPKGGQVHGVLTAAVAVADYYYYSSFSAMASLRQAREEEWEQFAAITAVVQEGILITGAQPGRDVVLPRNNPQDDSAITGSYEYRNSVQDRLGEKWSEAILGYQEVQSPSTGQTYQAPLNSYWDTGPSGPGYYRSTPSGFELLDVVNP